MRIITGCIAALIIVVSFYNCSGTNTKEKTQQQQQQEAIQQVIEQQQKMMDDNQFFNAALEGDLIYIQDALARGVDINKAGQENRTALMLAAYNGHEKIVEALIKAGAEVNLTDALNRTALMYASTGPFNTVVSMLLEAGADPNIADNNEHWTAVMFAAAEGQLEVVKTLLKHDADLSHKDIDGESGYDFAVANGHTEVANYLKDKK